MNRNAVVVDGTKPGSPKCSNKASDQEFGPTLKHHRVGLNGMLVWKADNVWIQNLTACNYLHGSGDTGNEIWWNGGHSDKEKGGIGGHGFVGSYLNATSTYYKNDKTAAQYGIFSSNWNGGTWSQSYASNFSDSGFYIGACMQVCNQFVDHIHAQFNVLGYSGSNSGGTLVVKNSEFDHNQFGFDSNSQNGDNPAPQNGACPKGVNPPVAGVTTCWVFMDNIVHDNNNPNVPALGSAAAGPLGTGLSLTGARNDTVIHNRFVNNNAWGVIFTSYPDNGKPCIGGTFNSPLLGKKSCLFDGLGRHLVDNEFTQQRPASGTRRNGDFEQLNLEKHPSDCFSGNTDTAAASPRSRRTSRRSTRRARRAPVDPQPATSRSSTRCCAIRRSTSSRSAARRAITIPHRTKVVMHSLPTKQLKSMPNPCAGVPKNPWCTGQQGLT